jgi:hypothetical protein
MIDEIHEGLRQVYRIKPNVDENNVKAAYLFIDANVHEIHLFH